MARLFLTPREINFMNDISKELVKDIVGQKIYLYQISEIKSNVHDIYEEAQDKIFDNPIMLDCLVEFEPQTIKTDNFGSEEYSSIKAYVQSRDLIDKGIDILEGDFFSYGDLFFEIVTAPTAETIYGQIEHDSYTTLTGKQARKGQFFSKIFGPTSESNSDADAVQESFYQQRGFTSNKEGLTADVRDLRKQGVLDEPITGPKEVSSEGSSGGSGNSFYDE
jgi:hypothetical protein